MQGLIVNLRVLGQQSKPHLKMIPNLKILLILLHVHPSLLQMPVLSGLGELLLPILGRVVLPLEYEEPVGRKKVNVSDNNSDRLHDIPRQIEIYEVMQENCLHDEESSEVLNYFP